MKNLLIILVLLGASWRLTAGVPTLSPQVTISLKTGHQVTFYADSEGEKVLYVIPTRLLLSRQGGRPLFNAYVYRGITSVTDADAINNLKAGKLTGGVADCILELQGPADFTELKSQLTALYPQYKNHRLAYVPLIPGSAAVTLSQIGAQESMPDSIALNTASSGAPVSSEITSGIAARFRLSELDAALLYETLTSSKKSNAFTAAFNVLFSAKMRMNLPATTITIKANKQRIYKFVESHFKAKGGFFLWGFSADIRKIRESLTESNDLKVEIDRQDTHFSYEQLQAIADKWLENFVLKEMHEADLENMRIRANAGNEKGKSFWGWGGFGTNFGKSNVQQFENRTVSFSYKLQGVEEFPIYANAEFSGLGPSNVVEVDLNKTYFSYLTFGVIPLPKEILESSNFDVATFSFTAKGENGKEERRVASFSAEQHKIYQTLIPLKIGTSIDADGAFHANTLSQITFDFKFEGPGTSFTLKNIPFAHTNWEYDMPSIKMSEVLGYAVFELRNPLELKEDFPKLEEVELVITTAQGTSRASLSAATPRTVYFFDKRNSGAIPEVRIEATYEVDGTYVTHDKKLNVGILSKEIPIRKMDIPALLSLGR